MKITRYSVTRPVTVIVLYALALGIAVTLLPKIAVDLYPSVAQPVLSVWTNLSGAGPADVEQNVTRPLEKALAASKNLVEMTSNSGFESSNIRLTFAYGTNMEEAVADAQALVNRLINALPDGTSSPVVRRFDISAAPVMRLVVRGNYPPDELRIFAEDEIQAEIERLDGVASADVTGGTTQIVRVAVSLNRLAALGLTLSDVTNALRGQNVLQSGGSLLRGTREYQLLTQQELRTIGQIKRLVVKTTQIPAAASSPARAQLTRLEDIADVAVAYNDNAARVSINGQNGVYIQVQAESDSNQVQVSKRVRAALDGINRNLPRGITLSVLQDNTTMINATLNQVYSNALQGAVLCMLIIFIFLRNIKSTLIIGISIPVSILLTLMCMAIFGFTLNLLTMTGLIMALGMTVDASIVILDNIHSYRLRGSKPAIAAILGSNEMFRPIVASTATTLCVFLPLVIYKNDLEMMGQLFSDLIFTVIISLVVSLVVALTAVPALAGPILKIETRRQKPLKNHLRAAIDRRMDAAFAALENAYSRALDFCLAHRALVLTLVLAVFAFSVLQADSIGMNMYFRTRTDDSVTLNVTLPQGTPIERTEKFLFTVEEIVKENVNGYINIILPARRNGQGSLQITLPAPAEQIDTPQTIQAKLTPLLSSFAG
ncbi:MAG: efflux RND transporter permease subunit, partial [Spirochaetaceae bacterium]|nr:efflux RND transporter permease subunit [Spirochaetaceae bacterium]